MRLNTGGGNINNPSTVNNNVISNNSNSMGTSGGGSSGVGMGRKWIDLNTKVIYSRFWICMTNGHTLKVLSDLLSDKCQCW